MFAVALLREASIEDTSSAPSTPRASTARTPSRRTSLMATHAGDQPGAAWMIALVGMHLGIDKSAGWVPSGRSEGILVTASLAQLRNHSPGP